MSIIIKVKPKNYLPPTDAFVINMTSEQLVNEYNKVLTKESSLCKRQRDVVVSKFIYLFAKHGDKLKQTA